MDLQQDRLTQENLLTPGVRLRLKRWLSLSSSTVVVISGPPIIAWNFGDLLPLSSKHEPKQLSRDQVHFYNMSGVHDIA